MADQLTILPNVKLWLNTTQSADDALLIRLISSASAFFLRCCNRSSLLQNTFTEWRNGTGGYLLTLANTPVQSVASLTVYGNSIPAISASISPFGYFVDAYGIQLFGYSFAHGIGNIGVTYVAGYPNATVGNEPQTIPAGSPWQLTVRNPLQYAGTPTAAYSATGMPLALVPGAPTVGQFAASSTGQLTFAAADASEGVLLGYQTFQVPADVEQAVIELVANKYKRKSHIGVATEHTGSEVTTSYTASDLTAEIKRTIANYRNVTVML